MLLSAGDHGDGGDGDARRTSGPGWTRHSRARRRSHTDSGAGHNGRVCRYEDGDATSHDGDPTGSFDDSHVLW